jgi:hypothetical protein
MAKNDYKKIEKKPHALPDPKLPIGGESEGSGDISHEEWRDIQHSLGALGPQVKINEKSKANENKRKGFAKAKAVGKKYG